MVFRLNSFFQIFRLLDYSDFQIELFFGWNYSFYKFLIRGFTAFPVYKTIFSPIVPKAFLR